MRELRYERCISGGSYCAFKVIVLSIMAQCLPEMFVPIGGGLSRWGSLSLTDEPSNLLMLISADWVKAGSSGWFI